MTLAERRRLATIASIRQSIHYWEARGMTTPAAKASALLERILQGGAR